MKTNNTNDEQELSKQEIELLDWMVKMINDGKITMSEVLQMIKDEKERNGK